jgi:hypothetical protein
VDLIQKKEDPIKPLIPFILGLAIGHWGLRWFIHFSYVVMIFVAFFVGKHFH